VEQGDNRLSTVLIFMPWLHRDWTEGMGELFKAPRG
jgi:hypothetical protein